MNKTIRDIILVIIGSFIFSAGINAFVISGNLGEGGVTGIAIVLYYAFHISPAITNFVLNAILIIVGYKYLSKRSTYLTIFATVLISIFLGLTETWHVETGNVVINAVFGGTCVGLGIGIIVLAGGTTAGTVILARIVNKYLDISTPYALLFFDLIVVLISLTEISLAKCLVTVMSLYIGTKVMEFVIEGLNTKKAMTIISSRPNEVAKAIDQQVGRGLTILNGHGYYTREEKDVLYVVISKTQVSRAKRIIKNIDENAFLVIHDVRDVYGNGFLLDE
ncbi:YitT family protein [Staphylococcus epidermidis]|uniref:YitT family protein n=1 Tax=Staphylococcus epidermidis TaxID=1282 RepID=UPI00026C0FA4|nr:YitT family protein [Staphylococcus epidermidis]EJD96223.1 YitT family protein [Staphylococcus epidermidis NIHLM057]EJD98155.1 YitT family protein [Staphylococcus epidermidis NIHLM053]KSZ62058.1 membrane protein [Staphylococcus epidermidis]KSZ63976.1 membrane protein [Staphylococcus epidermidis]KSZ67486.1 membrane protein [Staphylococcus epidermidis]